MGGGGGVMEDEWHSDSVRGALNLITNGPA